jgi:hypothetical protein
MAIDFNISPYYDDYSQSKNFYRILFKPGRAVQARELTQLQTILQKQIESIGTNIFKEGSLVYNGKSVVSDGLYLKLDTTAVDVNLFEGEFIIGAVSGARARVKKITVKTPLDAARLNIENPVGVFQNGEEVTIEGTTTSAFIKADSTDFTGPVKFFSIEESIFYTKGFFVYCDPQTIVVPATLSVNKPYTSARVGLQIVESIVNSDDDSSLLDPAIGTNNYFAPGADRYQIELVLKGIEYNPTVENSDQETIDNFIDLCNIRFGEIIKLVTKSDYNLLQDALAQRTKEESGDYIVKPFIGTVREHVFQDNTKFTLELSPGKAYVGGYLYETIAPLYLSMDKGRNVETINNFPIAADYSTYIRVSNVSGFINPLISQQFDIHSNTIATVDFTSNVNYAKTIIGNARVRYFEDINVGATDSTKQYRFYFYDSYIFDYQASNVRVTLNGTGYNNTNVQAFTTVSIATSGVVQPKVNATATPTFTGDGITGITLTNIGRGYTQAAINNTTVTISTAYAAAGGGNVQPTVNATATISFIENSFSNAKSFINVERITASPNVVSGADIYDPANVRVTYGEDDTLLFPVSQSTLSTFKPAGTSDTTFTSIKLYTASFASATPGNSTATITLTDPNEFFIGSGLLDDDDINVRFWGAVTSTGASTLAKKQKLNFNSANAYVSITGAGKTATMQVSDGGSFTANVLATVVTSSAPGKQKILQPGTKYVYYGEDTGNVNLERTDIYDIISIVDQKGENDEQGNSFLSTYILDNGQRDEFYDSGRLTLQPDNEAPVLNNTDNTFLKIDYRYFEHTGSGFFTVDSYSGSGITYDKIPTYTSAKGITYNLADVMDFRPARIYSDNSIVFSNCVEPGSTITADFSYYVGRIDRVVVTQEKKVSIIPGNPSLSPTPPKNIPTAMTLYTVTIPPYTKKATDVKLGYVDNRRYTMKDIGKIEKRVSRLEYYTALSFLEKVASDERVPSSVPGVDRFKNGILVDPFAGHSVGDVTNNDYACSIDSDLRYLRAPFVSDSYYFTLSDSESSTYTLNGDLVTPEYTETPFISQLQFSRNTFLTPHEVFTYIGEMKLSPPSDIWHDRENLPAVTVNINGENDAFTQIIPAEQGISPFSTKWNDWKSVGRFTTDVDSSVNTSTTPSTALAIDEAGNLSAQNTTQSQSATSSAKNNSESFSKTGLQFSNESKVITSNFGDVVKDASIIPYIRSRPVDFVAKNLKPNTTLFATFNDVDVTEYVFPAIELRFNGDLPSGAKLTEVYTATSSANIILTGKDRAYILPDITKPPFALNDVVSITVDGGTPNTQTISSITIPTEIATNQYGEVAGVFVVPNNDDLRFYVGERSFKLVDSLDKTFVTTAAETKYLAYGLSVSSQEVVLATTVNTVVVNPLSDTGDSAEDPNTLNPDVNPGYGAQDFFCGQNKKSSGVQGTYTFRINLGVGSLGLANVIVRAGKVPDRFTVTYAGKANTSGFITTTSNATKINTYNTELNKLGYNDISLPGTSQYKFTINKATPELQYVYLKIDAPFKGTGWSFTVECPTGYIDPAPGTAKVKNTKNTSYNFICDFNQYYGATNKKNNRPSMTARLKRGHQFTITNTSDSPTWKRAGDGAIKVNSINIDTTKVTEKRSGVSTLFGVETTGTSYWVYDGVHTVKNDTAYSRSLDPSNEWYARSLKDQNPTWVNTLGTLPAVIPRGESRTFTVFVDHPANSFVKGKAKVVIDMTTTGASANVIPHNDPEIKLNTSDLNKPEIIDPVAQTFFVESSKYPSGVFITSVDLWFATKDESVPVTLEIRPVINGFPSSFEILPFGITSVNAEDIVVAANLNNPQINEFTRFSFGSPVYLPPGQYSFVVKGNSQNYRIYTAYLGDFIYGSTTQRVTSQPYAGSMFKSQNASTWTPEQYEDVSFRINTAVFETTAANVILSCEAPVQNVKYDVFYTQGETLSFADTREEFYYATTNASTSSSLGPFNPYILGRNEHQGITKWVSKGNGNTLKFNFRLSTLDENIAPVVDLSRLSCVLIKNIINDPGDSALADEENYGGGSALAKYITRRVNLNPGFEAQDLKVYVSAYCPNTTRFKVYCKVNAPGTTQFDSQNKYQEMTLTSGSFEGARKQFQEFIFENSGNTVLSDGSYFTTFQIKIVMLSTDSAYVPYLRDLRVLALEDF